jgi:LacI family transcriptional regulator
MPRTAQRGKRITLADVAGVSGVSKTTASLILNDKSSEVGISRDTSARVWRAARKLGYKPNWLARALATGRTHLVGILTVHAELLFGTHYGPQLMRGFTHATGVRGYNIVVLDGEVMKSNGDREQLLQQLIDRQVEGLMVLTGDEPDPVIDKARAVARQEGLPVVEAWHSLPEEFDSGICVDNDKAADLVVSRLWELGHRTIALVVESRTSYGGRALERGFRAALVRRGVRRLPVRVLELAYEEPASKLIGGLIGKQLTASFPTAFFVAYDDNAMKIARELKRRGIAVPEDVSVVGYANDPAVTSFDPPLASVDLSLEGLGEKAATILLDWIEDGKRPGRKAWTKHDFVERSSIAPPRKEVMETADVNRVTETVGLHTVV